MGQHVNSQVLDATKASHCTGSVSRRSRAATPGGEDRTQVRTDKSSEESTAAPISQYLREVSRSRQKRADLRRKDRTRAKAEKSIPNRRDEHVQKKTQEHCQLQAQDEVQNKDRTRSRTSSR